MSLTFLKFKIISQRDMQSFETVYETILINRDHIVSIKPIKMVVEERVMDGYWLRTSNGKKYRAIEVPLAVSDLLREECTGKKALDVGNVDLRLEQVMN